MIAAAQYLQPLNRSVVNRSRGGRATPAAASASGLGVATLAVRQAGGLQARQA
jgi:hypothetical protein